MYKLLIVVYSFNVLLSLLNYETWKDIPAVGGWICAILMTIALLINNKEK